MSDIPGPLLVPDGLRPVDDLRAVPMASHRMKNAGWALVLAIPVVHVVAESPLPWWQRLLGAIPGMLAAFGWVQYLSHRKERLPFIEFGLLQCYVFWGLPTVTYGVAGGMPIHSETMTACLLAIALATTCFVVGYPLGCALGRRAAPALDRILPRTPGRGAVYVLPFWLVICIAFNTGLPAQFPEAIRQPLKLLGNPAPLLAYLFLNCGNQPVAKNRGTIVAVTALLSLAGLSTGMVGQVLGPMVTAAVLSIAIWRVIPWRAAAVGLLIVMVLQPAKHLYRSVAWSQTWQDGIASSFDNWSSALSQTWSDSSRDPGTSTAFVGRFNELALIATTFELTPTPIPHDHGRQWKYILITPIPRFLYPSKPNLTVVFNDYFNITFGTQDERSVTTSTNSFPLVSDAYWNFGWAGVVFLGILVGVLLGGLATGLSIRSWGALSVALPELMSGQVTANLGESFSGQFQTVVGFSLLCWSVRWLSSAMVSGAATPTPRRQW